MSIEQERASWVAQLAIAYAAPMQDGERLKLLGLFYDLARKSGEKDGMDRIVDRMHTKAFA